MSSKGKQKSKKPTRPTPEDCFRTATAIMEASMSDNFDIDAIFGPEPTPTEKDLTEVHPGWRPVHALAMADGLVGVMQFLSAQPKLATLIEPGTPCLMESTLIALARRAEVQKENPQRELPVPGPDEDLSPWLLFSNIVVRHRLMPSLELMADPEFDPHAPNAPGDKRSHMEFFLMFLRLHLLLDLTAKRPFP
ncbi:hypothetical protein VNI00_018580 [Paramarasmius palmivorus]|uniref:Uncharacterized protein n=1 Tax=Paramarasmius palmivorus TaxID=297713 RepID=A0AAW0AVG1_9AGAR